MSVKSTAGVIVEPAGPNDFVRPRPSLRPLIGTSIRLQPGELKRLGQLLNQSVQDAQDMGTRAINAFQGLDWNGQSRSGASDRVVYASNALR